MIARKNNERLELTGLLVFGNGGFLQVFEGPDDAVDFLYEKLCADPRHEMLMQSHRFTRERSFPEWRMGYVRLGQERKSRISGFSSFFDSDFDTISVTGLDPTACHLLDRMRALVLQHDPDRLIATKGNTLVASI